MSWACPYCGRPVGHEPSTPCCGEIGHEIEVDEEGNEIAPPEKVAEFEVWLDKQLNSPEYLASAD